MIDPNDPVLRELATDTQLKYLDAVAEYGSQSKAAEKLGVNRRTVDRAIRRLAEMKGYSPKHNMTRPTLDHLMITGHSDLEKFTDEGGEIKLRWNKYGLDKTKLDEMIRATMDALAEDLPTVSVPKVQPRKFNDDIIPWIQIGDGHFGMLAHSAETGQNFDMKIAERELCTAIAMLIDEHEPCERVVLNDVGDFTHYENLDGVTENSGHNLDVDGRFAKMIDVYTRTMMFMVDYCLRKFKYVDVIINQGNHSRKNDMWCARFLRGIYRDTDRVHVLNNDNVFIPYRMGNTFVMTHHSDKCKPTKLAHVMATDFRQDWGETEYHYIDIGHIHHNMVVKEHPGVHIESWNQLANKDKYAHEGGWRSRQSISIVYRSKKYGDIGRRHLPIKEVRDRILESMGSEVEVQSDRREVYTV